MLTPPVYYFLCIFFCLHLFVDQGERGASSWQQDEYDPFGSHAHTHTARAAVVLIHSTSQSTSGPTLPVTVGQAGGKKKKKEEKRENTETTAAGECIAIDD